jgi:hypothetical protein
MQKKINPRLSDRFTTAFKANLWEDDESVSGPGSRKDSIAVRESIATLNFVIENFNVRSINDIPCGDINWFGEVLDNHARIIYAGFDIVASLIERNKSLYPLYRFEQFDITSDIPPPSDLIFTKELFIHLIYNDITKSLANMKKSGSKYILSLNHFGVENVELEHDVGGYCRPFDLCGEPFNFPEPLWQRSYFGLWKIADI